MLNGLDLAMWTGLHDLKIQTHKHDSGLLKVGIKIKRKKRTFEYAYKHEHNDNLRNIFLVSYQVISN